MWGWLCLMGYSFRRAASRGIEPSAPPGRAHRQCAVQILYTMKPWWTREGIEPSSAGCKPAALPLELPARKPSPLLLPSPRRALAGARRGEWLMIEAYLVLTTGFEPVNLLCFRQALYQTELHQHDYRQGRNLLEREERFALSASSMARSRSA